MTATETDALRPVRITLRDASVRIEDAVTLIGRTTGGADEIHDELRRGPDDLPIVLMDHRPSDIMASRTGWTCSFRPHP
jgi:chemotaxis response regulator CheB